MNRSKLKEGFLVKKGYVRHNWKTRWFILFDDALCYYKRKEIVLLLNGEALEVKELTSVDVFRLISSNGREYLLQAASAGELQLWSATIAGAIREAESKERSEQKPKHCESIDQKDENSELSVKLPLPSFGELVEAMQDKDAGISLQTHQVQIKSYKLCFTGTQVIDWLISWSFVNTRCEGIQVGNSLLEQGHLQPVGLKSRNSVKQRGTEYRNFFCDGDNALYRFSALRLTNSESFELESDESSDSEDSDKEQQTKSIDGIVVKQGFLTKKGHVRHNWKTRKFVLCEQPPKLYYCRPRKADTPIGCINLDGASVEKVTGESINGEKKQKQVYGYRFKIRTTKGSKFVMQTGTKEELQEWILKIQRVCTQ